MEISEITVRPGVANSIEAQLCANVSHGDRGYWITINGWGETEAAAREQIDVAMKALDLTVDKIGEAV